MDRAGPARQKLGTITHGVGRSLILHPIHERLLEVEFGRDASLELLAERIGKAIKGMPYIEG